MFAQASIGGSSYNAGQVTLRHSMSHGLQTDFSYTFSKSLDLGSSVERIGGQLAGNYAFSQITNTFNPSQNYGVSDFDVAHLVTADWTYQFPFGRGKAFGAGSNWLVNGVIGGWEFDGLGALDQRSSLQYPGGQWNGDSCGEQQLRCSNRTDQDPKARKRAQVHFERPACRSRGGCRCSLSAYRRSGPAQQLPRGWLLWNRLGTSQALADQRSSAACTFLGGL